MLDPTQERVIADPQAQSAAQPFPGTTAQGMADHLSDFPEPLRLLAIFVRHGGQALTEDLAFTERIATTPTTHLQFQLDGSSLDRKILQVAPVAAVPGSR